jgi:hypothetical protein
MAPVGSLQGSLTASTSNNTADLIGNLGIDGASISIPRAIADATIDGSYFSLAVGGLYSWTVTAPFKFPGTPKHGLNPTGSFISQTGSGLYLTGVKQFSLSLAIPYVSATDDQSPAAETFIIAGPWTMTGSYTANVDSATALKVPGVGTAAIFKIADETTNDDLVRADVVVSDVSAVRARGAATEVTVSFTATGAIEIKGDSMFYTPANAATYEDLPLPEFDTVRVTNADGKYAEGSAAASQIQITRSIADVISGSVTLQGSGALTMA